MGQIYSFQLQVIQKDINGDIIGSGSSSSVDIYIYNAPIVISESFKISPECVRKYEEITELLTETYSLEVLSDSDYLQSLYQFGWVHTHYLYPSIISDASLSNIYLPIGDFVIFVNVFDAKSTKTTATINCSVTLSSYSVCANFKDDIISPYLMESTYLKDDEIDLFVLKQAMVYLEYLKYGVINDH